MRFRLVETGKSYAKPEKPIATNEAEATVNNGEVNIAPVIWETGNVNQIRSLLVLRQAELVLARSQLTGNAYYDWYTRNRIRDLEIKIAYLRRWLAEAIGRDNGDKS